MESFTNAMGTLSGLVPRPKMVAVNTLSWPLQFAHFPPHKLVVAQAIIAGTAIAICDGSYMPYRYPHLAAAAWIIHSGTPSHATCHGVTQVHVPSAAVNAYQAKLQGMLSLLLAINHLCALHHLSSGCITIGCDNQGVLHQVLHCTPGASKHASLLWAIHHALDQCMVSLSFQYVAGHQDDFLCLEDLLPLVQLNVQADLMAKQALHLLGQQQAPPLLYPLPGVTCSLQSSQHPIPLDPHPTIIDHLIHQCLAYWIQKGQFSIASLLKISWPLLGSALQSFPPMHRMWAA